MCSRCAMRRITTKKENHRTRNSQYGILGDSRQISTAPAPEILKSPASARMNFKNVSGPKDFCKTASASAPAECYDKLQ